MSWRTVHLAHISAVPWRNGGGMTRELVAWPTPKDWHWRMSVAEISADGAFSRFDGVTRWFAVLQGAGVALTVPGAVGAGQAGVVHPLSVDSPPLCFDGGLVSHCTLTDGPTLDFNLMVREGCLPARMVRVRGEHHDLAHASKTIAIYAVDSGASVRFNDEDLYIPPATLVWRSLTKAATVHIRSPHAMWMEWTT